MKNIYWKIYLYVLFALGIAAFAILVYFDVIKLITK